MKESDSKKSPILDHCDICNTCSDDGLEFEMKQDGYSDKIYFCSAWCLLKWGFKYYKEVTDDD